MEIKKIGSPRSVLSQFDLLGNNETALSKAFAFILGKEKIALNKFLKFIGVPKRITENTFRNVKITTEHHRNEGRTDIEIEIGTDIHIIIESKIGNNRVREQRTKYLTAFNDSAEKKVLVLITQERDSNKQKAENVKIINTSWLEVTELFNPKKITNNKLLTEFLNYTSKNYKMSEQKDILVQDVSNPTELKRFKEHNIYRRAPAFGTPLYFAPYFTNNANQPEGVGISYLSKVLGVLTLVPNEIDNYEEDLRRFTDDNEVIQKWIEGVKLNSTGEELPLTHYFLKKPIETGVNLLKDRVNSENWLPSQIPKNACVTFEEFVKRMNQTIDEQ